MDNMEEYTVNDDLRACGLPADDNNDLTVDAKALFGRNVAPINVDGPDDADACAGGDGIGASVTQTPTSTRTACIAHNIVLKHPRSGAWNDFKPIFETLPSCKQVRIAAKCRHCNHVLSSHSSSGTRHLLRHQKQCLKKAKHARAWAAGRARGLAQHSPLRYWAGLGTARIRAGQGGPMLGLGQAARMAIYKMNTKCPPRLMK
ncbi:hypothetical protein PVAP13_8KG324306 [Panicum virgatum]|uniref:BED-type domain-containing protein n=1 Tax=Panicum virgatum TaxID=38727 RepID=A0A8T0PSB8_PANVG|nr:hypothetical protein PVAP13_8KG324306 [Panicum virgatum]